MTSTLNLSEVPALILEEAAQVLNAEGGAILLIGPGEAHSAGLLFAAATGPGTEAVLGRTLPPGTGIAGWVAQTGMPALVDDTACDPRFTNGIDAVTGLKTRSLLAVPVRSSNGVIGVLELHNLSGTNGEDLTFHIGGEYRIWKYAALRAGYDADRFVAGVGFFAGPVRLDIAAATEPLRRIYAGLSVRIQ